MHLSVHCSLDAKVMSSNWTTTSDPKEIDGKKCEPIEELTIDLPEEYSGTAVEAVTKRKGEMLNMEPKGAEWSAV